MSSSLGWRVSAALAAAAALLAFGVVGAQAQNAFHGIAFTKGCDSPTNIGDPYDCAYQIVNAVDTAHDTLQVNGLSDQVHSAGGDVNSGNILGALQLIFSGPTVTCTGGSGSGTVADPYVGATSCTLPFGTSIETNDHSFYTVAPGDFTLPGHSLTDTATLNWADLCDGVSSNCTPGAQTATAGSSTLVQQLTSTTATQIHNAAHQVVTTVEAGTTVHDLVTVTGQPGKPFPSGSVNIDWFLNGACSGSPAVNSGSIGPLVNGQFDATAFSFTVNAAGFRAFRAHYGGDATYLPSDGGCEPLRVVDANIQLSPGSATNPVGTNHVLTCHINVDEGTGSTNAPAGTTCTVNITSGPGTPATQNCSTVGTTGDCQATITSAAAGTTTVQATTTVSVAGLSLTRTTGDAHVGDSPNATKLWADDTVSTNVRDAANNDITNTTVTGGTVVHDEATVAKTAATPVAVPSPTGSVSFTLYDNGTCNGNVVATDPNKPLNGSGVATSATFTTPANGTFSYLAHYNGDANYPAHDGPCEPFTVQTVTRGLIAPTQTTCSDFINGTAATLGQVNYTISSSGKIAQSINPGVFFYYTKITTTVPNQVVTVSQSNTSTNNAALFGILNGQAWLYPADCSSHTSGTILGADMSGASFTIPTPGTYIIGLKYQTKSLAGTTPPVPADITYNFTTSLGGTTGASVLLKKQ